MHLNIRYLCFGTTLHLQIPFVSASSGLLCQTSSSRLRPNVREVAHSLRRRPSLFVPQRLLVTVQLPQFSPLSVCQILLRLAHQGVRLFSQPK